MTKRVFIIGAPLNDKRSVFYNGVMVDVNNFYSYFQSPTGGGFLESEITYLENPTWALLKMYLQIFSADYVVFVFSGHGYHVAVRNRTVFVINGNGEEVSLRTISDTITAPKQLIISDSCRNYVDNRFYHFNGMGDPAQFMTFPSILTIRQARIAHNNLIENSFDGLQVLYSCSPGESSTIASSGSVFSKSLLTSINKWATMASDKGVMNGGLASKLTERSLSHSAQTPQCKVSEPYVNFPIALKAVRKPSFYNLM